MIVGLDLERGAPAVAEVDDAGILTGRNNHAGAGSRQALQMNAGRLVRTVLGPHDGKDTQLNHVGSTAWIAGSGSLTFSKTTDIFAFIDLRNSGTAVLISVTSSRVTETKFNLSR